MYGVMKAYSWKSIEIPGVNVIPPIDGPQHFIPIFDTYSQALKFTDGDKTNVVEMELVNQESDHIPKIPPIPHKIGPRFNAKPKASKRYVKK